MNKNNSPNKDSNTRRFAHLFITLILLLLVSAAYGKWHTLAENFFIAELILLLTLILVAWNFRIKHKWEFQNGNDLLHIEIGYNLLFYSKLEVSVLDEKAISKGFLAAKKQTLKLCYEDKLLLIVVFMDEDSKTFKCNVISDVTDFSLTGI